MVFTYNGQIRIPNLNLGCSKTVLFHIKYIVVLPPPLNTYSESPLFCLVRSTKLHW